MRLAGRDRDHPAADVDRGRFCDVLATGTHDVFHRGLGALLPSRPFLEHCGLVPLPLERALSRALPPIPTGALWLVGHRALRNVPRVVTVWSFIVANAAQWR